MTSSLDEEKNVKAAHVNYFVDGTESPDQAPQDVFGDEADHDIQYKTLSWQVRAMSFILTSLSKRPQSTVRERVDDSRDC